MSTVTGVVKKVVGPNKGGFYSLLVNDVFHGFGKSRPSVSEGDTVSFEAYLKDGQYSTIKGTVNKVEQQTAQYPTNGGHTGIATNSPKASSKDTYWSDKDKYDKEVKEPRITFLAAYERAVQFVDLAIRNGAISLEKVKGPDKLGVIEAAVAERTQQIIEASNAKPTQYAPADAGDSAGTAADPDDGQWS